MFESAGKGFCKEPVKVSCIGEMQQLPIVNSTTSDPGPTKTLNEKQIKCDVCHLVIKVRLCDFIFSH